MTTLREEIKLGILWNNFYCNEVMEKTIKVIEKRIDSKIQQCDHAIELEDVSTSIILLPTIRGMKQAFEEVKEMLK